jgi:BolA protein
MEEFQPLHLEVINESDNHSVPKGSESHFRVVIVSERFAGKSRVKRHQEVYACLGSEFASGLHALSQYTYAPEEWKGDAPSSPQCAGGSKSKG